MFKYKLNKQAFNPKLKYWLVTVDMGYGHQRAAYPLSHNAFGGTIIANNYRGIPKDDREIWVEQEGFYNLISRFKAVPVLGDLAFKLFDKFQEIPKYYPKRDLSRPSMQLLSSTYLVKHRHWGEHLIKKLSQKPWPLVTPFFSTAIMAENYNYPGEIYCIICDTDISRSWVTVEPQNSRIKYFAPNIRVVDRLQQYGVPKSRIFFTGFPLPDENLGSPSFKVLRDDLAHRFLNLDPNKKFLTKYKETLLSNLKLKNFPKKANHPLTITFAVGGAGAQRELGSQIVKGLAAKIKSHELRINLIAGVHQPIKKYFAEIVRKNDLTKNLDKDIFILYEKNKQKYFKKFNYLLRTTDILWTKPSELSFYCALGLPIIIAPPIGSQEDFNLRWLVNLGAGNKQEDPKYVKEWLYDWIDSGWLAEAAMHGFLEAPRNGTYNIMKIVAKQKQKAKKLETISQY